MLRSSLRFAAVAAVVLVLVAWLMRGGPGAVSAAAGVAVVVGFFSIGHIGVRAVISGEPALSLAGAFVVYLGQLIAVVVAFIALRRVGWIDGQAFAAVVVVETLVWQAGQIVGFRRARHEIYPDVTLPKAGA